MAEMARRLKRISESMLQEEMEDIILTNTKPLKQAKESEFEQGLNPDGTKIGRYRSPEYAKEKNIMNPIAGFGNVDLIYSGRFVRELYPYRTSGSRYLFANRLDYGRNLIQKYGEGIEGLNNDTFFNLQKNLYAPQLVQFIKKQIGQ